MKTNKIILGISCLSLLFSCSNEEGTTIIDTDKEEVEFSTNIYSATVTEETRTRANDAFPAQEKMRIIVKDNTGTGYFSEINTIATAGTASGNENPLTLEEKLYWDDLGGKSAILKVIGIHPNTNKVITDNVISWEVPEVQTGSFDAYDLKLAQPDPYSYGNKAQPLSLIFNHKLTKITMTLKGGGDFSVDELNTATVTFNAYKQANYNIVTNEITNKIQAPITPVKAEIKEGDDVIGYSYTILTFPFEAGAGLASIIIKGNTYTVNANAKSLDPGVHATFPVVIDKSEITVTGTVTDWTPEPGSSTSKKLVEVGNFNISGTTDTPIKGGSVATFVLTGSNNDNHTIEY